MRNYVLVTADIPVYLIPGGVCRLCYLFCRATRAVSVCPPAYYAHLAAFRQRELCQMSDSSASDTESTMSGTAPDANVEFATCHKDLGSTMYYV